MNAPKLELRQSQSLVMTQELQQSIKLLQCNSIELKEFVEQALEENPFLTQDETHENNHENTKENPDTEKNIANAENEVIEKEESESPREADFSGNEDFSDSITNSENWDDSDNIEKDYLLYEQSFNTTASDYNDEENTRNIGDNPDNHMSLREHLLNQLHLEIQDPAKRLIGAYLIDLVDDAGYIKEDLSNLCEIFGTEITEIKNVLSLLQGFDPTGICAVSLSNCLELQLKEKNRLDPAMRKLLDNLHLLADNRFDELQKKCGVDKEDLRQMVAEIRALNPKPGSSFSHEVLQSFEPDIFVRRTPDGNWHVELNMANFPKVMVNKRFYKKVNSESKNKKDKEYLSEKFGAANWLIRALEQRAQTILKVTSELVKQQDAFFRLGIRYLKPMTLKDIAAATGYHESTISRVTNGKYLICPRGSFELKYFFTSALTRSHGSGDDVSSQTVKHLIAEIIDKESSSSVFMDEEIAEKLKEKNINIARRTVAKYRESLGIPSSAKRKRIKNSTL